MYFNSLLQFICLHVHNSNNKFDFKVVAIKIIFIGVFS